MLAALVILALITTGALVLVSHVTRRQAATMARREAAWAAERRELLNRIMYMANHPWQLPPELQVAELDREPPTTEELIYHDLLPEESWQP